MQNDFRIRMCFEQVRSQLIAQLDIVVNLPIVRNPVPCSIAHRLLAGDKVDNAQPPVRKPNCPAGMQPGSFTIRPSVDLKPVHDVQHTPKLRNWFRMKAQHTGDTAHVEVTP
jgi:hypothetical protein